MLTSESTTPTRGQAARLAAAGAILDGADTDNLAAFNAWREADADFCLPYICEELFDVYDATREPLRVARSNYFAISRKIASKRPVPRLPDNIPDARAMVTAASNEAKRARQLYDGLMALDDLANYRDRADAAVAMERSEQIFEALRDTFNAQVDKYNARLGRDAQRAASAQIRAFNWQQIEAAKRRGIVVRYPHRKGPRHDKT